eukprot:6196608-Pleurochrysis_carterae.AAC.1
MYCRSWDVHLVTVWTETSTGSDFDPGHLSSRQEEPRTRFPLLYAFVGAVGSILTLLREGELVQVVDYSYTLMI